MEVFVDLCCLKGCVHGASCFVLLLWFLHVRILISGKFLRIFSSCGVSDEGGH